MEKNIKITGVKKAVGTYKRANSGGPYHDKQSGTAQAVLMRSGRRSQAPRAAKKGSISCLIITTDIAAPKRLLN